MYAGRIVESAAITQIFYEPIHPYNQALQKSIPGLHEKRGHFARSRIPPPDLSTPTQDCPFVPRCEYAEEKCTTPMIVLKEVAPGHFSARLRIE
jgi:oligopeptide/dipeptide ABC transporter ATP-binding protein